MKRSSFDSLESDGFYCVDIHGLLILSSEHSRNLRGANCLTESVR